MAGVQFRALGECALETGVGRICPDSRYVFALGLYLVLERGRRIPRQALVDLLWPDVRNEGVAKHRFRQTLLRLKQLGVPVDSDQSHLRLDRQAVATDFETLLNVNGDAEDVLGQYESFEFLQGYQPRISEQFTTWLDLHRARVELAIQRVFVHALKSARTRGDWEALERLALGCLRIDPLNEEANMARAEATAMRGSKHQALRILDTYMDALGERSLTIGLPAKLLRSRIAERLTQPRYAALSEAHFVGREAEVSLLSQFLEDARSGRGKGVLLIGTAGIGKTRLVTEITRIAELRGIVVAAVNCQPGYSDRPLGLLISLVGALRALPGSIGASGESLALLQRLSEYSDQAVPFRADDPPHAAVAISRAVFDLFDAVVDENLLLLAVEDVHWADAFSLRVFGMLAEAVPRRRALIVATSRDESLLVKDMPGAQGEFHGRYLPPLGSAASEDLLAKLIADFGSSLPSDMASWCVSVAEGNPYYLRELLTNWLETQKPFGVPHSLNELIDQRIARLSPEASRVFQAIVGLGSFSTLARLERLEIVDRAQLVSAIEELSLGGLVRQELGALLPKHDLLAQAASDRLLPALRALLHRRIAGVLEDDARNASDLALLWECARHWRLGGEGARALRFLENGGRHMIALGLPDEAAAAYRRALELDIPDEGQLAHIYTGLLRALRQSGLLEQVLKEAAEYRARTKRQGAQPHEHSEIELLEVEARWRRDRSATRVLAQLNSCLEATDASPTHRLDAAYWILAAAHTSGDVSSAQTAWTAVEPLIAGPHDPIRRSQVAMVYHTDYGDMELAVEYARQAVDSARSEADTLTLSRVLRNASLVLRRAGQRNDARGLLLEAFDLATRTHAAMAAVECAHQLAAIEVDNGCPSLAAKWIDRAAELQERCENPPLVLDALMTRIRLALLDADIAACCHLTSQLPDWRREQNLRWKQMMISLQLMAAVNSEDIRETSLLLKHARSSYSVFGQLGQQDFAVEALAAAEAKLGRVDGARALLESYLTSDRRDRGPLIHSLHRLMERLNLPTDELTR